MTDKRAEDQRWNRSPLPRNVGPFLCLARGRRGTLYTFRASRMTHGGQLFAHVYGGAYPADTSNVLGWMEAA